MDYNITYRQKDKGWQYIISYKINGKWKQKSKQGFKTKKEAKPYAEKMLNELKKNINSFENFDTDYDKITFKSLSEIFLKHIGLHREYNTIKGFKCAIANFTDISDLKVISIKRGDIQRCVDYMVEKGLSGETIKSYLRRTKQIFNFYIENYNPSYALPIFKISYPKNKKRFVKKGLSKLELEKLFKNISNSKFFIVAYIAGKCGMRCGEILGLTWNDLDVKNRTLNVNKQWKVDIKTRKSSFGELKSKNSNRIIPISNETLKFLLDYKKNSPTDRLNRIAPFNHASIEKYLNPILRKYADISIHELRHTYATILISAGTDFKTVAKLMGHDVEQTLKTYSHVNDDMMEKAKEHLIKYGYNVIGGYISPSHESYLKTKTNYIQLSRYVYYIRSNHYFSCKNKRVKKLLYRK